MDIKRNKKNIKGHSNWNSSLMNFTHDTFGCVVDWFIYSNTILFSLRFGLIFLFFLFAHGQQISNRKKNHLQSIFSLLHFFFLSFYSCCIFSHSNIFYFICIRQWQFALIFIDFQLDKNETMQWRQSEAPEFTKLFEISRACDCMHYCNCNIK